MADSRGYERCPVVFNLNDPFQRKLYKHTQKFTNYSAYMKSLVQRDMEGGAQAIQIAPIVEVESIDKGLLSGLI